MIRDNTNHLIARINHQDYSPSYILSGKKNDMAFDEDSQSTAIA